MYWSKGHLSFAAHLRSWDLAVKRVGVLHAWRGMGETGTGEGAWHTPETSHTHLWTCNIWCMRLEPGCMLQATCRLVQGAHCKRHLHRISPVLWICPIRPTDWLWTLHLTCGAKWIWYFCLKTTTSEVLLYTIFFTYNTHLFFFFLNSFWKLECALHARIYGNSCFCHLSFGWVKTNVKSANNSLSRTISRLKSIAAPTQLLTTISFFLHSAFERQGTHFILGSVLCEKIKCHKAHMLFSITAEI